MLGGASIAGADAGAPAAEQIGDVRDEGVVAVPGVVACDQISGKRDALADRINEWQIGGDGVPAPSRMASASPCSRTAASCSSTSLPPRPRRRAEQPRPACVLAWPAATAVAIVATVIALLALGGGHFGVDVSAISGPAAEERRTGAAAVATMYGASASALRAATATACDAATEVGQAAQRACCGFGRVAGLLGCLALAVAAVAYPVPPPAPTLPAGLPPAVSVLPPL